MNSTTSLSTSLPRPQGEVTCLGDTQAMKLYEYAAEMYKRHATTPAAREIFKHVLPQNNTLRAWWRLCKKDLDLTRMAVIRVKRGESAHSVHDAISARHSMLKTRLLRFLELRWLREDRDGFMRDFFAHYEHLGLGAGRRKERAEGYAVDLEIAFA